MYTVPQSENDINPIIRLYYDPTQLRILNEFNKLWATVY